MPSHISVMDINTHTRRMQKYFVATLTRSAIAGEDTGIPVFCGSVYGMKGQWHKMEVHVDVIPVL